jgi:hypothetical protein
MFYASKQLEFKIFARRKLEKLIFFHEGHTLSEKLKSSDAWS